MQSYFNIKYIKLEMPCLFTKTKLTFLGQRVSNFIKVQSACVGLQCECHALRWIIKE